MFDLIIKNATVITVDPDHSLYQPGFVAVKGDRIAAIGPMEAFPEGAAAPKVIDADGLCVMPGLVDAHGHAGHCLTKTLGKDSCLRLYIECQYAPYRTSRPFRAQPSWYCSSCRSAL